MLCGEFHIQLLIDLDLLNSEQSYFGTMIYITLN